MAAAPALAETAAASADPDPVFVVSRNRRAVLALVCDSGTFFVLVTDQPGGRPWLRPGLRPMRAFNVLPWRLRPGPWRHTGWYQAAGHARTWLRPQARRWIQALAHFQAAGNRPVMALRLPAPPTGWHRYVFDLDDDAALPRAWAKALRCGRS